MISTIRKAQYPTSVTGISKPAVIALAATLLLMAGSLMAQELTGRITGTVTDEQGAFMPGAEVTATHVETNYVYRAVTLDTGRFTMPKVRLGRYTVAAEMAGFRRAVVQDVIVEVGGTASLRITLQVGEIQEEITVTAETTQELVNTVDTELGAVVDERRVLELPLDGRNAIELTFLQAGVYFDRDDRGRGQNLFVHGQRDSTVNITLNGVDVLDQISRFMTVKVDFPMLALAAENVQEFRVITGIGISWRATSTSGL
ncbi:MAG: carboxypeptidase-like regulatory domain-containing protein, partial [Acidobacteriota bacterium]